MVICFTMNMSVSYTIVSILTLLASGVVCNDGKLMLFLVDGFRWDYFDRPGLNLSGFQKLFQEGSKAISLEPVYPSNSYPNYYSLMTGLYAESHGMIGNYMYDERHGTYFQLATTQEHYDSYWWDDAEPLWVTAERQNKSVYMYQWPGCDVKIRGYRPTYCKPYSGVPTLADLDHAIVEGLELFKNHSADVVGIYVELMDFTGHRYGPNSRELDKMTMELDIKFEQLLTKLENGHLRDKIDVLIFSDHGMTDVSPSRVVNITDHVDMADVDVMLERGSLVYIWPNKNKLEKVYNDLKGMNDDHLNVLYKDRYPMPPQYWYFQNHYRIPPILLAAEPGWSILTPLQPNYGKYENIGPIRGSHGYDNKNMDMKGIFLATGPGFKKNYTTGYVVKAVDLYQVMCDRLNIRASPNNGTLRPITDMLVSGFQILRISSLSVVSTSFLLFSLTSLFQSITFS